MTSLVNFSDYKQHGGNSLTPQGNSLKTMYPASTAQQLVIIIGPSTLSHIHAIKEDFNSYNKSVVANGQLKFMVKFNHLPNCLAAVALISNCRSPASYQPLRQCWSLHHIWLRGRVTPSSVATIVLHLLTETLAIFSRASSLGRKCSSAGPWTQTNSITSTLLTTKNILIRQQPYPLSQR